MSKHDEVYRPSHYANKPSTTYSITSIVSVGLPSKEAYLLGNVIKYIDRRDDKGHPKQDLKKARNYAHRLVTGKWRKRKKGDKKRN